MTLAVGSLLVVAQGDRRTRGGLLRHVGDGASRPHVGAAPMFLETLSLKLLQTMGYGGRESLLEHTGKPGDSGLEGMVRQHALGVGTAFAHTTDRSRKFL